MQIIKTLFTARHDRHETEGSDREFNGVPAVPLWRQVWHHFLSDNRDKNAWRGLGERKVQHAKYQYTNFIGQVLLYRLGKKRVLGTVYPQGSTIMVCRREIHGGKNDDDNQHHRICHKTAEQTLSWPNQTKQWQQLRHFCWLNEEEIKKNHLLL